MALPANADAPLSTPDHRDEHARIAQFLDTDGPRGVVAFKYGSATVSGTTARVELMRLTAVPLKAGRLYRLTLGFRAINTSTATAIALLIDTNGTIAGTNLVVAAYCRIEGSQSYDTFHWNMPFQCSAGDVSPTIIIYGSAGAGWNVYTGSSPGMRIDDIGPVRGAQ